MKSENYCSANPPSAGAGDRLGEREMSATQSWFGTRVRLQAGTGASTVHIDTSVELAGCCTCYMYGRSIREFISAGGGGYDTKVCFALLL